ncbi:hypothetical protein [Spiroplasma endosymbiont of Polydrusus pterygomalis]|uniref:hypothetical protein n=1 Tax=Spiroplasma endosymbiont of Polydrusus pterygomalis TaxID=3139327 RepID=UPI003CCB51F5
MLRTNQLIVEAEKIIENSKKSYINKRVIEQQINNEELFYDTLEKQPWFEMKAVTPDSI